ncbi:MAG: glycoside hydrolase family 47 protein [Candidatus Baltobacteraceae bacterium]
MKRKTFLSTTGALAAAPALTAASRNAAMPEPHAIAAQVKAELLHAWNGYKQFAWGFDEYRPVSRQPKNFFIPTHSFGLSIIEAMDTLYVMGLDAELELCVEWLRKNMAFDVDGEVQMFEAVIRMVAGLISGYYATNEKFLLDGARDLADRLLPCFTKSPTGAPYRFANLKTGAVRDPKNVLAEIGSNVLEFGDLSRLTGEPKYLNASMKAYEAVLAKRSVLNLLGTNFDIEKGEFIDPADVAPDEPVDSFYEYLWGGWQMLGIAQCRDWYRLLTDAILRYKVTHVNGSLWFKALDYTTGLPSGDASTSDLAAFYAGLLAKGGDRAAGEAFYNSWTRALDKYELLPEVLFYPDLSIMDPRYWMRPEYPNSSFDLWFLTNDVKYRRTAYGYFIALREHCRTPNGYTVLTDIRTRPMTQGDYFPAYSFSENFKYLYLMFAASTGRFDASNHYLNTEGKVLRGLLPRRMPR